MINHDLQENKAPKILEATVIPNILTTPPPVFHLFSIPKQRLMAPLPRGIGQFAALQCRIEALATLEALEAQRGGPLQAATERSQHGAAAEGAVLQKGHPGVMGDVVKPMKHRFFWDS